MHCGGGVSRSAAVVIGYVMYTFHLPYVRAVAVVEAKRRVIAPNAGFVQQLMALDARGGAASVVHEVQRPFEGEASRAIGPAPVADGASSTAATHAWQASGMLRSPTRGPVLAAVASSPQVGVAHGWGAADGVGGGGYAASARGSALGARQGGGGTITRGDARSAGTTATVGGRGVTTQQQQQQQQQQDGISASQWVTRRVDDARDGSTAAEVDGMGGMWGKQAVGDGIGGTTHWPAGTRRPRQVSDSARRYTSAPIAAECGGQQEWRGATSGADGTASAGGPQNS